MNNKTSRLVIDLGQKLKEKNLSLVTAESCTGGGLAYYISINPETSPLLERGYVSYSNNSKQELLEVKPYTLQTHGAVSKEVAVEMAQGALKNSTAQVSIAITGIAGPDKDGQPPSKKGLAWICCADFLGKTSVQKKIIAGSRQQFCEHAIAECLLQLLSFLNKIKE